MQSLATLCWGVALAAFATACCDFGKWAGNCPDCESDRQVHCSIAPATPFNEQACLIQADLRYTALIPPGAQYRPGTIISIGGNGEIIVEATKGECFAELLPSVESTSVSYRYAFSADQITGGSVSLEGYLGAALGADARVTLNRERVTKVSVEFGSLSTELISTNAVEAAISAASFSPRCRALVSKHPVVVDALQLASYELTLYDKDSHKIDLSGLRIADLISVSAGTAATLESTGRLAFTAPTYVGYKLKRFGGQTPQYCCDSSGTKACAVSDASQSCAPCSCTSNLVIVTEGKTCF
jgi:hypothetical protein